MDNVIDMFFKKDASAEESQETAIETFVTSEQNDDNAEKSSSPDLSPESASSMENEAEALESAGGADVEEGGQSTHEDNVPLSLSGNGQFSLFGDDDFVTPGSEEDKGAGSCGDDKKLTSGKSSSSVKSSSKKTSGGTGTTVVPAPTPKRKKDQNLEVSDEWSIHYATESFRVTDFVNPFPASGKVKLEELRVEMEKEFYEMTKARTTWDYDEDLKRLYPDVTGTDKGCW